MIILIKCISKSLRIVIGFVRHLRSQLARYVLIAVSCCVGGVYVFCMRNYMAPAAHNAVDMGPSHVVDDISGVGVFIVSDTGFSTMVSAWNFFH
jgi:hypothetical protein